MRCSPMGYSPTLSQEQSTVTKNFSWQKQSSFTEKKIISQKQVSIKNNFLNKNVVSHIQVSFQDSVIEIFTEKVFCHRQKGKSFEHPRLGWVGIENKWSQLNPNFWPSRATTNLPYRFSWHIKLFIPKVTKIKYILNASLSVRIQFLCLWFNWYHNYFFP